MLKKKERCFLVGKTHTTEYKNCLRIFCIAAIIAALLFLPFVIYDNGMFLFYGDYNAQQIPFYQVAHDAIRNGNFGWNWNTDLGSNLIASYSFYLLGSPFFWLTIPFPTAAIPYLMAPLFVLKFALAATTGYAFIRRFTVTVSSAMIGGLLYAFSGFMIYNVFYNHFHEVVVFFPLLLIGLEELVVNQRKGLFALSVAVNLIINYYFFVAEIIFLILYFALRCTSPYFNLSLRKFGFLALETILGGLMGSILLLPSAIMVLQNPRVFEMLLGYDMLFYGDVERYGLLIQSLFFPPDMPALPNFFPDSNANWYSVAAYLPMFGMAGVLTFLREKRRNWLKFLLLILFTMMFIPILNSLFNGLNSSFYTRWFYMLTLMMALATAQVLEHEKMDLSFGIKVSFVVVIAFSLIGVLPSLSGNQMAFGQMPNYPLMFWVNVAISLSGILILTLLYKRHSMNREQMMKGATVCLCGFILLYSIPQIAWGKTADPNYYEDVVERGLNAEFSLDESEWNRIDVYHDNYLDNWPMYWGLPSIQAFQSTVEPSIMEFYPEFGISRDVASRIPPEYDGLREFLSVKYLFVEDDDQTTVQNPHIPPGFSYYDHQNDFDIYENQHFLPMGIPFTTYLDSQAWEQCPEEQRDRLLLKGVYLTTEQLEKYQDFLTPVSKESLQDDSDAALLSDVDLLAESSSNDFTVTDNGFSCSVSLKQDSFMLFTVPFDYGWSATVDGVPVTVEKVDFGFMAVPCTAGEHQISFTYRTPGLRLSIGMSLFGLFLYLLYLLWNHQMRKRGLIQFEPSEKMMQQERRCSYLEATRSQIDHDWDSRH